MSPLTHSEWRLGGDCATDGRAGFRPGLGLILAESAGVRWVRQG
ncbi:MAG TPA: hypothetical protein VFP27_06950 [Mycobacterium sp.]|nr:hypothetical protein [Mycobacterium sp.]